LSKTYKIAIFSDDIGYRNELRNIIHTPVHINIQDMKEWEIGFLEFLCLSYNCKIVCGTPHSSFSEQASIFGNKPYFKNLDPKLEQALPNFHSR
jgi:hypothetical protein